MVYTGEQKKAYQLQWLKRRRESWIENQGGKCVDCASNQDLEIDHVDPTTKSVNPTSLWSKRKEVREAELAKCVVRCKACHLIKTIAWRNRNTVCGTFTKYQQGCRCDLCKKAAKLNRRKYPRTTASRKPE